MSRRLSAPITVSKEGGRTSRGGRKSGKTDRRMIGGGDLDGRGLDEPGGQNVAAQCSEHRTQRGVETAHRGITRAVTLGVAIVDIARRKAGLRRVRGAQVPDRMRERGILRKQKRCYEDDPPSLGHDRHTMPYFARHSSRPARKRSFGSFLPMNTRMECFFSALVQGLPMSPPIIMCTPWNTTRRGLPFIHSTPL